MNWLLIVISDGTYFSNHTLLFQVCPVPDLRSLHIDRQPDPLHMAQRKLQRRLPSQQAGPMGQFTPALAQAGQQQRQARRFQYEQQQQQQ